MSKNKTKEEEIDNEQISAELAGLRTMMNDLPEKIAVKILAKWSDSENLANGHTPSIDTDKIGDIVIKAMDEAFDQVEETYIDHLSGLIKDYKEIAQTAEETEQRIARGYDGIGIILDSMGNDIKKQTSEIAQNTEAIHNLAALSKPTYWMVTKRYWRQLMEFHPREWYSPRRFVYTALLLCSIIITTLSVIKLHSYRDIVVEYRLIENRFQDIPEFANEQKKIREFIEKQ